MGAYGIADRLSQAVERPCLFEMFLRFRIISLKGFITDIFADTTRLEGGACSIAVVGQGAVDYSGIVPSVNNASAFFD